MTDPFGTPSGSSYPKPEDLEGKLLLLRPTGPPTQVAQKAEYGGGMRDRYEADTTVFEEDGTWETYSDMYWSQAAIANALKQALKPGGTPMVLGHLVKVATKDTRKALPKIDDTPESFAAARAEWLRKGGKGTEPKHVWVFSGFTEAEAQMVRDYLKATAPADPFAAGE